MKADCFQSVSDSVEWANANDKHSSYSTWSQNSVMRQQCCENVSNMQIGRFLDNVGNSHGITIDLADNRAGCSKQLDQPR